MNHCFSFFVWCSSAYLFEKGTIDYWTVGLKVRKLQTQIRFQTPQKISSVMKSLTQESVEVLWAIRNGCYLFFFQEIFSTLSLKTTKLKPKIKLDNERREKGIECFWSGGWSIGILRIEYTLPFSLDRLIALRLYVWNYCRVATNVLPLKPCSANKIFRIDSHLFEFAFSSQMIDQPTFTLDVQSAFWDSKFTPAKQPAKIRKGCTIDNITAGYLWEIRRKESIESLFKNVCPS